MKTEISIQARYRERETGAALVMVLLIMVVLMMGSAALILETTSNTYSVTDLNAEYQAYNAAETGIQAAVNVLRDNVTLQDASRIDPAATATARVNRIDYLKAIDPTLSNAPDDSLSAPRLSRWMPYDLSSGRVVLAGNPDYSYQIELSDPDHTGSLVTYSTLGRFHSSDTDQIDVGTSVDGYSFRIVPQTEVQIDTSLTPSGVAANFGSLEVTRYGLGAAISNPYRFEIVVSMTHPYSGVRVIRGYVMPNSFLGGLWALPVVIFDSKLVVLHGSVVELKTLGEALIPEIFGSGPPPGYPTVLPSMLSAGTLVHTLSGTMTSPEPVRLRIKSTGFGPRGSTKQLEAIIQKNYFNGLNAPATLTLVGPSQTNGCALCSPAIPPTTAVFNPGSSTVTTYSGQDQSEPNDIIPPIGTNDPTNLDTVADSVDGRPPHPFNGDVIGVPSDVTADMPFWLASPEALDSTIRALYEVAVAAGRYFPNGEQPDSLGDPVSGRGITFCDGDCELNMDGGGILVVTGQLTVTGNFAYKGMIIVTGQGGVSRTGGGSGTIFGNMVVAPYINSSVEPASEPAGQWLSPQYDLSGGGNSAISYDSSAFKESLSAVDNFVLGIVEK